MPIVHIRNSFRFRFLHTVIYKNSEKNIVHTKFISFSSNRHLSKLRKRNELCVLTVFTRNVNKSEINFVLVRYGRKLRYFQRNCGRTKLKFNFIRGSRNELKKSMFGYSSAGDYEILNPKAIDFVSVFGVYLNECLTKTK